MVKFCKILTVFGAFILCTLANANECEEFEEFVSDISVRTCEVDENQQMTFLKVTGNITQEHIEKIASYSKLTELQFYRFEDNIEINLESLTLSKLEFNHVYLGPRSNRYSGFVVPEKVIKTIKNVDEVNILGYKITQGTIDSLATLNNVKKIYMHDGGFDEGLDFINFSHAKSLTTLHLHSFTKGPELGVFPESLCQLKKLKSLEVESKLTTLPKCIGNLKNLENLDLAYNYLTEIPKEIGNLTKLKSLGFYYNKFTTLPSFLKNLTKLEKLELTSNDLIEITNPICNLKKLKRIDANFNDITKIPSCIGNLSNLVTLNLRGNKITSIPSGLYKLKKLEVLDMGNNLIKNVSTNIKNLKKLHLLYLFSNELTEIPEGISNLINLTDLSLDENRIKKIPDFVCKLTNLKDLSLSYNLITEVPECISQLTQLEKFEISNNPVNTANP